MFRSIFYLAVVGTSINSLDSCVDSDSVSAMQNRLQNRLQDRSGQQVSHQVVQGNVEQAIATKGKAVEGTASGKSSKSIAELEMIVKKLEGELPAAQEAFSKASDGLKQHMRETANMAASFHSSRTADLAEAFTEAEAELLKIETKLATRYDDLALKLADKLQWEGSDIYAQAERDNVMAEMDKYYKGSEVLHDEINVRMKELAEEFHGIKENVLKTALSDKLALDAATKDLSAKIANVERLLEWRAIHKNPESTRAYVGAANAAEHALVIALTPAVDASEQFRRIGEIVQNILVQTTKKLWSLRSSVQRHGIQAMEARSSEMAAWQKLSGDALLKEANERKALSVQGKLMPAEFLLARAEDFGGWQDRAQADFDWQNVTTVDFMSHLEDELHQAGGKLTGIFLKVVGYRQKLVEEGIHPDPDYASSMKTIRMELYRVRSIHAAVIRTRTSAAKSIAEDKNTEIERQLKRAKASSNAAVTNTVAELTKLRRLGRAELRSAKEREHEGWLKARELPEEFCNWADSRAPPTSGIKCQPVM